MDVLHFYEKENLYELLTTDDNFLQYFNSFLSSSGFKCMLLYNRQCERFEKFHHQLVDTKNGCIVYKVQFIDYEDLFDWLKERRLGLFVQSEFFTYYTFTKIIQDALNPSGDTEFANNDVTARSRQRLESLDKNGDQILFDKNEMDAFKLSLLNQLGEKYFLLWTEVERCKNYPKQLQSRMVQSIKDRFLLFGSPNYVGIESFSKVATIEDLLENIEEIRRPILEYWFPRYKVHKENSNKEIILADVKQVSWEKGAARSARVNSCHLGNRTTSVTQQRLRVQSVYPHLISTQQYQNTNAGEQQLQLTTTLSNYEGFGFIPTKQRFYQNEAADADYKSRIRLFIPPLPPPHLNVSTLTSKNPGENGRDPLEGLVHVLLNEKYTGNCFLSFLLTQNNKLWLNCLYFWQALQEYNEHFFSPTFVEAAVQKKANVIFLQFIHSSGDHEIELTNEMREKIFARSQPPFEELFDNAEKEALVKLLPAYQLHVETEMNLLKPFKFKDKREEIHVKQAHFWGSDLEERLRLVNSSASKPIATADITFEHVLTDETTNEQFLKFLKNSGNQTGVQQMSLCKKIDEYSKMSSEDPEKDKNAMRKTSLKKSLVALLSTDAIPHKLKDVVLNLLSDDTTEEGRSSSVEALHEIRESLAANIRRKWFTAFKNGVDLSTQYHDQLMKQKLMRNDKLWAGREATANDIKAFRQALTKSEDFNLFKKFLKLRAPHMSKNLEFWREIQKYKYMCHSHVDVRMIESKIHAINTVFLRSLVPPALQVALSQDVVERLISRVQSRKHGPYLFREAQAEIFKVMISAWMEYVGYTSQLDCDIDEQLRTLERTVSEDMRNDRTLAQHKQLMRVLKKKELIPDIHNLSLVSSGLEKPNETKDVHVTSFSYAKYGAKLQLEQIKPSSASASRQLSTLESTTEDSWSVKEAWTNNDKASANFASMPRMNFKTILASKKAARKLASKKRHPLTSINSTSYLTVPTREDLTSPCQLPPFPERKIATVSKPRKISAMF